MKRLIFTLVAIIALAASGSALATTSGDLNSIQSQFICTSCHEPLELVSSPQALSEKAYLSTLLDKHLTMTQIKDAMVSQYGVAVLAQPPAHGFNLTVYVLPPAILILGLALLAYTLPKWRERSRQAAATPLAGADPLAPAEEQRLNDELDRFV